MSYYLVNKDPTRLCNIGYPSETHLKLKSAEILYVHNLLINHSIVLKFCPEHGSDTAMLCAKFQNDWTTETDFMDERDIARFEFKMSFRRISYIVQHARLAAHFTIAVLESNLNPIIQRKTHYTKMPFVHTKRHLMAFILVSVNICPFSLLRWYLNFKHMMTSSNGNIFRVTGHLCGEFTGPRWIPHTKASDAELWCFLWSASE